MNSAERKFLYLAIFLFALGGVSRLGLFNKLSPLESIPLQMDLVNDSIANNSYIENENENEETAIENDNAKSKKEKKPKKKAPAFPLNINTASKDDLCFIKGVGPSLAQKIIDYREQKGNFRNAKDLEKVPGIGVKKRQAMEEFVRFD